MKRKLKKQKAHKKKRNLDDLKKKGLRTLISLPGGDKKKDDNNMKFNFLPGFAGMPFPPFMMNGPHFHPPIDVTVNSIPNPNPKADLNPFEIENANLQTQINSLSDIKTKMFKVESDLNQVNQQITDGL